MSPELCKCLTKTASKKSLIIFKTNDALLELSSDGKYVQYYVEHDLLPEDPSRVSKKRRRRRLMDGMMARGGGGGS